MQVLHLFILIKMHVLGDWIYINVLCGEITTESSLSQVSRLLFSSSNRLLL